MAISYVGAATGTNTATLPSFESGDIAVAFAFRDGSATNPTIPGTFTNITNTLDTTSGSGSVGWRRLVVGDTTIGTWTNASRCVVGVYRGCEPFITPVGGGANGNGTTNGTVPFTTFTMTRGDSTSWVLGFAGHRSTDTDLGTLWTNMVSLRNNTADATAETCLQDTNGGVSSWNTQNRNIGGTNSGWVTRTVELLALPTQLDFPHPVAPIQIAHSRSL
jgi:hypothetical protein